MTSARLLASLFAALVLSFSAPAIASATTVKAHHPRTVTVSLKSKSSVAVSAHASTCAARLTITKAARATVRVPKNKTVTASLGKMAAGKHSLSLAVAAVSRGCSNPTVTTTIKVTQGKSTTTTTSGTGTTGTTPKRTVPPLPDLSFLTAPLAENPALQAEEAYEASGDSSDAAAMATIANEPTAIWLDGSSTDATTVADLMGDALDAGQMPTFVLYNIPDRDCGSDSAGGAASAASYEAWAQSIADELGSTPAIVIVEPDALAELTCWSAATQASNLSLLNYDAKLFGDIPFTYTYLDAGNSSWQSTSTMAGRLKQAGIAYVRGFSLNVSNFQPTSSSVTYGDQLSALVGGAHFVIDTSRNGGAVPAPGVWCNPPGAGLGTTPTENTGDPLADAFLWVKYPGRSDGNSSTCGAGAPAAGTFWNSYALSLVQNG